MYIYMCLSLALSLSIKHSIYLSTFLPVYLSIYLFIYLSNCVPTYTYIPIHTYVYKYRCRESAALIPMLFPTMALYRHVWVLWTLREAVSAEMSFPRGFLYVGDVCQKCRSCSNTSPSPHRCRDESPHDPMSIMTPSCGLQTRRTSSNTSLI